MTTSSSSRIAGRRRRVGALWGGWFSLLVVAVLVAQVTGFGFNDVRSGARAETVDLRVSRLLDTELYREIDRVAEQGLRVRGTGLWARWFVDYRVFRDSTSADVVVGNDEWLFLADYVELPCDLNAPVVAALEATTVPATVTVSVTEPKSALHADELPSARRPEPCWSESYDALVAAGGDRFLDLSPALRRLRDDGRGVFFRDDTHWSVEGRLLVAESIVEWYAPGLWDDDVVVPRQGPRLADLSRFLGRERNDRITIDAVDRRVEVLDEEVADAFAAPLTTRWHSRAAEPDAVPGTTLVVGDSQMAHVIPLIAGYFEELVFVNWLIGDLGGQVFIDDPSPDRIFVQSIAHSAASRLTASHLAAASALVGDGTTG